LQLEYAQKMRDIYTDLIFRSVTASKNFALLPSEQNEDQSKIHEHMASLKRKEQEQMLQASKKNEFTFLGSKKNTQLRINKIIEIPEDGNT